MRNFDHTVNVLVQAYLKGTLQHTNCHACAVGNMVAEANGVTIVKNKDYCLWQDRVPHWFNAMCEGEVILDSIYLDKASKEGSATGYEYHELARIEHAFESVDDITDDDGYKGLMAVVDVLADIHGINLEAREEAKLLFVKQV